MKLFNWIDTKIKIIILFIKFGKPDYVLYFGDAIGDNLLLSALAAQINKQYPSSNIWVLTKYASFFKENQKISYVSEKPILLSNTVKVLLGIKQSFLQYYKYDAATDKFSQPEKHIINVMCTQLGLDTIANPIPEIFLTDKEISDGNIFEKQICIQSEGRSALMQMNIKEWYPDRFQEIVNYFSNRYQFIQIGSVTDYPLQNVLDKRGKTSFRESAALLKNSLLFIGLEGFIMHLAASVNCKSVIIFGGRSLPDLVGYSQNINIYTKTECSPCWGVNSCDYNKKCMDQITAESVISEIENYFNRYKL